MLPNESSLKSPPGPLLLPLLRRLNRSKESCRPTFLPVELADEPGLNRSNESCRPTFLATPAGVPEAAVDMTTGSPAPVWALAYMGLAFIFVAPHSPFSEPRLTCAGVSGASVQAKFNYATTLLYACRRTLMVDMEPSASAARGPGIQSAAVMEV
jgi:hypothetical protein